MSNDAANALAASDDDHPVLEMHMSSPHLMPRPLIGFIDSNRSQAPGVSERSLWIAFYIVLAVLGAIGVTVGLLQRASTGEALPPPPPSAR